MFMAILVRTICWIKDKTVLDIVSGHSEYKKAKGGNKNRVAKISLNEYKDVLLNKKYLRRSMNRIQRKNHRIRTYQSKKNSVLL